MRWDAGSFMVMKNSVFTSQAKSIKSSSMGDWKSCNDPVNIHPWTPLARNMASFEHKQKLLLSPRSGSFAAETHLRLVASAESLKFPTRGSHDTLRLPHTCTSSSWCMLHLPCHRCNPSLHPIWKIRGNLNPKMLFPQATPKLLSKGINC